MKNQKILLKKIVPRLFDDIEMRKLIIIEKEELINRIKDKKAKKWLTEHEGIERCYHGYFNGSEIIVCTSWSDYSNDFKTHDSAWVLLINPCATEPYFSNEIKRYGNFAQTIINWLDYLIELAVKWPTLPNTPTKLRLVRGRAMHQRIFVPPNDGNRHPRKYPYIFNLVELVLSEKSNNFILNNLKNRIKRRQRTEKEAIRKGRKEPKYRRVMRSEGNKETKEQISVQSGVHYEKVYNDGPHTE